MEPFLFAVPFVLGTLTGATVGLTKIRDARSGVAEAAVSDRVKWGWILTGVGIVLSAGAILLQGAVASQNATSKASETAATECIKTAVGDNQDPSAECSDTQEGWESDAQDWGSLDGIRALVAALGTTVFGLGFGDLVVKPLAK